jgi:hypothetical protein
MLEQCREQLPRAKNCPCHRAIRPTWMWEMQILHACTWTYMLEQCREQLPRAKICRPPLDIYPPWHDHQGWWKCNFCRSKKLSLPPGYTTHMDVGNADFAWSKNLPSIPGHIPSLASLPPGYTVHPWT